MVDPEEEEGEGSRLEVAVHPEAGVDSEDRPEAGSAVAVAAVDVVALAAVDEAATKFAREACGTGTPDHLPPSRAPFRLAPTTHLRVVSPLHDRPWRLGGRASGQTGEHRLVWACDLMYSCFCLFSGFGAPGSLSFLYALSLCLLYIPDKCVFMCLDAERSS